MNRRQLTKAIALGSLSYGLEQPAIAASSNPARRADMDSARMLAPVHAAQGRLGVHIVETATGQEFGYRADERFMMLSSFKLLASAVVLARVDAGEESLERRITYSTKDLVTYLSAPLE